MKLNLKDDSVSAEFNYSLSLCCASKCSCDNLGGSFYVVLLLSSPEGAIEMACGWCERTSRIETISQTHQFSAKGNLCQVHVLSQGALGRTDQKASVTGYQSLPAQTILSFLRVRASERKNLQPKAPFS